MRLLRGPHTQVSLIMINLRVSAYKITGLAAPHPVRDVSAKAGYWLFAKHVLLPKQALRAQSSPHADRILADNLNDDLTQFGR